MLAISTSYFVNYTVIEIASNVVSYLATCSSRWNLNYFDSYLVNDIVKQNVGNIVSYVVSYIAN